MRVRAPLRSRRPLRFWIACTGRGLPARPAAGRSGGEFRGPSGTRPTALTDAQRALEYAQLAPAPDRFLLTGETFPAFTFTQAERARELHGAYKSTVVYSDSDYRSVTKATKPGRSGAVVEIAPPPESKLPRRGGSSPCTGCRTADLDAQSPALVARLKAPRWNYRDLPLKARSTAPENSPACTTCREVPTRTVGVPHEKRTRG